MKFTYLFFIVLAVVGCWAEDVTTPAPDPESLIQNILDQAHKILDEGKGNVHEKLEAAQKKLRELTDKMPGVAQGAIKDISKRMSDMAEKAISTTEKAINGALEKAKGTMDGGMSGVTKTVEELQKCAEKFGKEAEVPENPIGELSSCIIEQGEHIQDIVKKSTSGFEELVNMITAIPTNAMTCASKMASIFSFPTGVTCFLSLGGQLISQGTQVGTKFVTAGVQTGGFIMSAGGAAAACLAKKSNNIIQQYAAIGVDINKCIGDRN